MERLFIVGPGRMGLTLGYALRQADAVRELVVSGRRPEPPSHPLFTQRMARYVYGLQRPAEGTTAVFLAVPDDAVAEVAEHLAAQGEAPDSCAAFHLSGALSTEPLAPLHSRRYAVGSFHPLQTVSNPVTGADRLSGCSVAVAGEPQALRVAYRLVSVLGCSPMQIPVRDRPLYHAAAVLASNNLAALIGVAAELLEEAGIDHEDAIAALLPLVRGTVANIEEAGLERSLTGPAVRGDVETVGLHLRRLNPSARRMYATLGKELLTLVERSGGDEEAISTMQKLFEAQG